MPRSHSSPALSRKTSKPRRVSRSFNDTVSHPSDGLPPLSPRSARWTSSAKRPLERRTSDSVLLPVLRQKSPAAAQRKVSLKDMSVSALSPRSERSIPPSHKSDYVLLQATRKAVRKDTLIPSSAHPVDAPSEAKRSSWHLPKDQQGFMSSSSPRSARWSTTNSMRAFESSPTMPTIPTSYVVGPAPFTQTWWDNITGAVETSGLAGNDCHI
jgi:hypothetical protein